MSIKPSQLIEKFQYALDNHWGYIWGKAGDVWTQAQQNAATREQTVKYGQQWVGHYVADCSGLFSWAFKQLGGYMYHGSNTMYNKYCAAKGEKTSATVLNPGMALFTGTKDDHGHVGLYIGNGYVIEAKGTQSGVVKSKASEKRWTYWGELKGVDYGETPSDEPTTTLPTIRQGDKGEVVATLQRYLVSHGYDIGAYGIDGDFGSATLKAVKKFQENHKLAVDGVVGKNTWKALLADPLPVDFYTVTIQHLPFETANELGLKYGNATIMKE